MEAWEAKALVMEPRRGRTVVVTGGRKSKGASGIVFYIRDGRIGFKDSRGESCFVDEKHVTVVYPDLPLGSEPPDWVAYHTERVKEDEAILSRYSDFCVGDIVVVNTSAGNLMGLLWWRSDRRISIRMSNAKDARGNWAEIWWGDVVDIAWKQVDLELLASGVSPTTSPSPPYDTITSLIVQGSIVQGRDALEYPVVDFPMSALSDATPHLRNCIVKILPC